MSFQYYDAVYKVEDEVVSDRGERLNIMHTDSKSEVK